MAQHVLRLLADIGGTHATFGLQDPTQGLTAVETLRTADFPGPEPAIRQYLAARNARPEAAAIAIACPITPGRFSMTNCAWSFEAGVLRSQFDWARLELLNDFEALAMALPSLQPGDLLRLGPAGEGRMGTRAVLGPGTGLGVAALLPASADWIPLPGEGGHVTLAPADDLESAVLVRLRRRFGHVSAERVLSGPGLVNLHEALAEVCGVAQPALTPEQISREGLAGPGPARDTLAMFCAMLGGFAGNVALTVNARGGIYIGGGVARRLADFLPASAFRERFEAKGRFRSLLAGIATWLITAPHPALHGCANALGRPNFQKPA